MHPMRRRDFLRLCARTGLYAGIGASFGLSGCLQREAAKPTQTLPLSKSLHEVKGTYISGTSAGDAETLNWALVADNASREYIGLTMDGLVVYDNDLNILLRWLAEPIRVSEDGLTYTLILRDDLMWSDGKQVTAEDFVYTYKNILLSDWLPFNYKDDYQETVDGEKVFVNLEAVDKTTYRFVRQTVEPEFLYTVTDFWVYPKHIVEKYEGDPDAFTQAPELNNLTYTGNLGPYRFVEWIRNDKFVLERNPDYYLGQETGAPFFEKYIVKIFGTPAARHAAFEAGDITSTLIDPLQVRKFKELEGINVYTVPTGGYTALLWNFRKNGWEGFKKREVREAFAMSIGKDAIVQSVYLGFGDPAFSFIPKPSPWYIDEGLKKYGVEPFYDKEKAVEMLDNAGYPKMNGKILDKDGEPLRLSLIANSGNKVRESIAFLIKQELSDIGVEIELKFLPWPTELNQYLKNKIPGTDQPPSFNSGPEAVSENPWDLCVMGFGTDILAPSGSVTFFGTDGGLNMYGYSNERVDELFASVKSKEALDEAVRRDIYGELSLLLSADLPVDFLVYPAANSGFQEEVKGIEPGISIGYNYHLWRFEK
ncbi:MAG: ABC transporter substrate-binding protein [Candidatus Hydrothermarchaeales archaeon]